MYIKVGLQNVSPRFVSDGSILKYKIYIESLEFICIDNENIAILLIMITNISYREII